LRIFQSIIIFFLTNFRWRKKRDQEEDDGSSEEGSEDGSDESDNEGSDESSGSEDEGGKKKGVHNLIEIENPNRVQKKQTTKLKDLDQVAGSSSTSNTKAPAPQSAAAPAPELSRREREELERQQKQANYQKLHAQGKTEQARADLARLAIIRQQREEAAKMREQKRKEAESKGKAPGK